MTGSVPEHFVFAELSEELARIDQPWRCLWFGCVLLGSVASAGGAVLLGELWRSGSVRPVDWLGPAVLLACLAPAALAAWALRNHPPPPTEAWISGDEVRLGGLSRPPARFRWGELRRSLVIGDFRSTPHTWRQDGSPRRVEFVLLHTRRTPRTPLSADAFDALLRSAQSNGFAVQQVKDVRTAQGTVQRVRLMPPRR